MNRTDSGATAGGGSGTGLLGSLEVAVPSGISGRASDRLAMAHDASHYLLTPRAVVTPTSIDQVAALLRAAAKSGVPLTFRSNGTVKQACGLTSGAVSVGAPQKVRLTGDCLSLVELIERSWQPFWGLLTFTPDVA